MGRTSPWGLALVLASLLFSEFTVAWSYGTSWARVLSELQARSASFLPLGEIGPATLAGDTSRWCDLVRVERVTAGFLLCAW